MDKNLMEFWGNLLVGAAKSQRQWEELTAAMNKGLPGLENFAGLFQPSQNADEGLNKGVGQWAAQSAAYLAAWQKAVSGMQNAYTDFLKLTGVVPEHDYRELSRKCEELEEQVRQQQETIRNLNELLRMRHHSTAAVSGEFDKLIRRQTQQFQDIVDQFRPKKDHS